VRFEIAAQFAEQRGVFRELLHQDLAGAVEDALDVGEAGLGVEVACGFAFGGQHRVGIQRVGERLEAGFAGDLRLAAPLRFVRQVEVFEALLGFGGVDLPRSVRASACPVPRSRRGCAAPLFELAQVEQALVEQAQLDVVETAGHLLAVAGDERHGRPFVEQRGGGLDLLWAAADFFGDLGGDTLFGRSWRHR
jgi:hypothetical protein